MSLSMALRYGASYAALVGAALCLAQIPSLWARQDADLAYVPTPESEAMGDFTVVIDAGHGGVDGGTQGQNILEKNLALTLSERVEELLKQEGIRTFMTRRDDTYIPLERRSDLSNRHQADAFISIHLNADGESDETAGLETYYCSRKRLGDVARLRTRLGIPAGDIIRDGRSEWLAGMIHNSIREATGVESRGVRDSNFHVIMHSEAPSVLIECGYLTNDAEARRLKDGMYQEKLAGAIAGAVKKYLLASRVNPRRGIERNPMSLAMPSPNLREGNP